MSALLSLLVMRVLPALTHLDPSSVDVSQDTVETEQHAMVSSKFWSISFGNTTFSMYNERGYCKMETTNLIVLMGYALCSVILCVYLCQEFVLQMDYCCLNAIIYDHHLCRYQWMCDWVSLSCKCFLHQHTWILHMWMQHRIQWRWSGMLWWVLNNRL